LGPGPKARKRQSGEGQGAQRGPGGPQGGPKEGQKEAKIGPFWALLGPLRGPKGKEGQKGSPGRVKAGEAGTVRGASPPDTPPKGGGGG